MADLLSLNNRNTWQQLYQSLGQPAENLVFPCRNRWCPACREQKLAIYGTVIGGWGHCRNCSFRGTALDAAKTAWRLSLTAAGEKLKQRAIGPWCDVTPATIQSFEAHVHRTHSRIAELLSAAQITTRKCVDSHTLTLQETLHLRPDRVPRSRWESAARHVVVAVATNKLLEATRRVVDNSQHEFRTIYTSPSPSTLAFPLYDAPDHVSGFFCIGHSRQGKHTTTLHNYRRVRTMVVTQPGVSMLPLLPQSGWRQAGGVLYIVPDVALAARLQLAHISQDRPPLPVLGMSADADCVVPAIVTDMRPRRIVFWCPHGITTQVLREARRVNGVVAHDFSPFASTLDHMVRTPPPTFLKQLNHNAVPWYEAVAAAIVADPDAAEDLILTLGLSQADMEKLRTAAPDSAIAAITAATEFRSDNVREAKLNGKRIRQQNNQWLTHMGELMCDATLRITHIHFRESDKSQHFRGEIRHRECVIPFSVSEAELTSCGVFDWMNQQLLAARRGPLMYDARYEKHVLHVSQLFYPPAAVVPLTGVGWDEDTNSFNFPGFRLGDDSLPPQPVTATTPCRRFQQPTSTYTAPTTMSERSEAGAFCWAAVTAIAANVLAPASHRDVQGVALLGSGCHRLGPLLLPQLGCVTLAEHRKSNIVADCEQYAAEHTWPATARLFARGHCSDEMYGWLQAEPRNLLLPTNWLTGQLLRMSADWQLLESYTTAARTPWVAADAQAVLPQFLQHHLANLSQGVLPKGPDWLSRINAAMADWWQHVGGDPQAVIAGLSLFRRSSSAVVEAWVDTLCWLYFSGFVQYADSGSRLKLPAIVKLDSRRVYVSFADLNAALQKQRAPTVAADVVTEALRAAGALLENTEQNPGWVVRGDWWETEVAACKSRFQHRGLYETGTINT